MIIHSATTPAPERPNTARMSGGSGVKLTRRSCSPLDPLVDRSEVEVASGSLIRARSRPYWRSVRVDRHVSVVYRPESAGRGQETWRTSVHLLEREVHATFMNTSPILPETRHSVQKQIYQPGSARRNLSARLGRTFSPQTQLRSLHLSDG